MERTNLLCLLHLADSTLPIGGYAHSSGLETYVQKGLVDNKDTALQFVTGFLSNNIFHTDASLLSLAYDAAINKDMDTLIELDLECNAVKLPSEIRMASQKIGIRLNKIFTSLVKNDFSDLFLRNIE